MPPSGYYPKQSNAIKTFLVECVNDLIKEGKEKELNPLESLEKECNNIEIILQQDNSNYYANNVLELTHQFYKDIIHRKPKTYNELKKISDTILKIVSKQILDVHVPEIMK